MLNNFFNQLRNNPRLRWGIALIIGIAWLYAVLLLRDSLQEQTQQHRSAAQNITRLRVQLAQPEWAERVAPAKVMAVQLEGKLWQAATPGLAQAALQDWLNAELLKVGINKPQINVTVLEETPVNNPSPNQETGAATPADLWKIKAKLSFETTPASLMDFLSQIELYEKQVVVGGLTLRKEPTPRAEMELFGYFQKPAAANAKPTKESVPL